MIYLYMCLAAMGITITSLVIVLVVENVVSKVINRMD